MLNRLAPPPCFEHTPETRGEEKRLLPVDATKSAANLDKSAVSEDGFALGLALGSLPGFAPGVAIGT
jgi:hypothetical protein